MKRPPESRDDESRPKKQHQIDLGNTCFQSYFQNEAEISPSELPSIAHALPEDKFISGEVFMDWPSGRISIRTSTLNLEITFSKAAFARLSFIKKDKVCISLRGAKLKPVDGAGSSRYPFNLVYDYGTIVKFMASEKRKEEIVNAFEPQHDTDSWFLSPCSSGKFPDPSANNPERKSAPEVVAVAETTNEATPLESIIRPEVFESISEDTETVKQLGDNNYTQSSTSSHQGIPPSKSSSLMANKKSANRPALANIPQESGIVSGFGEKAPAIHQRDKKEKRMKKRDTRHVNVKESQIDGAVLPLTDKLGKRARQKLRRAEAGRDKQTHPPRDSALDLAAGFTSEKGEVYQAIASLQFHQNNSVVGIVTDVKPIKTTRNGDCSKSFVLIDPSQYQTGVTVVTFASQADKHLLPSAKVGQALLFQNIWVSKWCGRAQAVGHKEAFSWCGYDPSQGKQFYSVSEAASSIAGQSSTCNMFHKLSPFEFDYFIKLCDWRRASIEAEQRSRDGNNEIICFDNPKFRGRRPTVTISEMKPGVFVDCVAQLLQTGDAGLAFVTAFITDYTENILLENYTPPSDFPLGRRTLRLALWDAARAMVNDLEPGAFYLFENIRLKKPLEYLEGNIGWGDDIYISKISINSGHELVADILRRKLVYEKKPNASKLHSDSLDIPLSGIFSVPEPVYQAHTMSKQDTDADEDNNEAGADTSLTSGRPKPVYSTADYSEGFLECPHIQQKCTTIQQVHESLRCPNKFLLQCQIVEYYPLDVKHFICAKCSKCNEEIDIEKYDLCPICADMDGSIITYYQFALRIIDESSKTLDITVHDKEAEELLRDLPAADAREDIAALKARLFPLIGHLYSWHETLDEAEKKEGPWVNLSVFSWMRTPGTKERLYKLFDCYLPAMNSVE